ncbi:hypothetical protein B5G52_15785 [Pseudoalteromonas sp. A601]|nr:hypothetical protein B5G52_15785 [Pseudoalteromonas sp. A601]
MLPCANQGVKNMLTFCLEKLPACTQHFLQVLPNTFTNLVLTQLLNRIFSEQLNAEELDYLEGKWLKVEVIDLGRSWFLSIKNKQFLVCDNATENVTFSGKFNDFSLLAAGEADPDMLFFNRRLHISGETELGLLIKSSLENLEIEHLPAAINFVSQQHSRLLQKYGV